MAILVTGAAGFIGYHVSRALLECHQRVVGIDNLNSYYDPRLKRDRLAELERSGGDFQFIELDFANWPALDNALYGMEISRIVHLGAQAGVRYSIENPHAYVTANLVGHLNLLELARQRNVIHCVYASSSSVYGGNKSLPFRVDDRVDHPISLYAATKKADELMSEVYAHLYSIPLTGLRFFTVYGEWGRPDMAMWLFTDRILAGRPIQVFRHGRMRRDFTHVDDIVAGLIRALNRPPANDGVVKPGGSTAPHAVYNLGNSRPEELETLIGLIERACGKEAVRASLPIQPGDVPETYADIADAARDLDFSPRVTLEDGVPRFVEWFKRYRALAR